METKLSWNIKTKRNMQKQPILRCLIRIILGMNHLEMLTVYPDGTKECFFGVDLAQKRRPINIELF
ncbi:MAG: hypothetical protein FWC47_15130 [Oscillospiraceae bacterium]|nr:hypothetical protein [Oscillospiraceae bacterium]